MSLIETARASLNEALIAGFFIFNKHDKLFLMRTLIAETVNKVGEEVELMGWVAVRRDHGKLIFIDFRDRSGACQVVFIGKDKALYGKADQLRSEWVVKVSGQVNKRPEAMVNKDLATGEYEVLAEELEILNEATTPPFDLSTGGMEVGEEVRMKHRYIDLRRGRLQKNIRRDFFRWE